MPGPSARPAALRLLNGRTADTDSGGRKVDAPINFARSAPEAPDWLPDEARAEWDRIVPELTRMRLIKPIDRATLTAYCLSWSRFVDITHQWDDGDVSTCRLIDQASKELRQWAREFGLTPSAEGGLHPPELPDAGDPFA